MADQYVETGVPFLRSLNVLPFAIDKRDLKYILPSFHNKLRKSALTPGDVVIVRTGRPGACAVIPDWITEANCSDLVIVRIGREARPGYITCVINSAASHHISAHTVGAVQQHFNVGSARAIRLLLPSLVEQDRILNLLGALNDKIELNRRMAETLETMARALFRSWFVDFDPVHSRVDGRPTGLPDDLAALFPDRFDDDGLPERWFHKPVGTLVANVIERVKVSPETASKPYIPIDAILPKSLCGVEPRPGHDAQSSLVSFEQDDILFGAMRPYFHKVCIAPSAGTTRTTVFVLRPRDIGDLAYCLLLMSEEGTIEFATNGASGSTIPYATWEGSLENMPIVIPPPRLRAKFGQTILPTLRRSQTAVVQSRTLATLRDTLLPKLISGELRIADAEKRISAA